MLPLTSSKLESTRIRSTSICQLTRSTSSCWSMKFSTKEFWALTSTSSISRNRLAATCKCHSWLRPCWNTTIYSRLLIITSSSSSLHRFITNTRDQSSTTMTFMVLTWHNMLGSFWRLKISSNMPNLTTWTICPSLSQLSATMCSMMASTIGTMS